MFWALAHWLVKLQLTSEFVW